MVRLGDYIEECDKRNGDLALKLDDIRGVSIEKKFIATKANMDGVSLIPYKVVEPGWFCYVTVTSRNGEKISLAYYGEKKPAIVSSSYIVFRSKDEKQLLPEYLYLFLCRPEFDRYARFNSWGSARETFDFSELCRTEIPLPSLDTQRELVAIYDGLKKIVAENEALIKPLEETCRSFLVDLKKKYPSKKIGPYIRIFENENRDGLCYPFYGVNKDKNFMPTVADTNELDNRKYKIVSENMFVFSGMQTGRDNCIRLALNDSEKPFLISPAYTTFIVESPDDLLSEYLFACFNRKEMDRYGAFLSDGSIRSNLDWGRFCSIEIHLPPIEIQQAVVNISKCIKTAKRIIQETRARMKNLCPALVQKAVHSA